MLCRCALAKQVPADALAWWRFDPTGFASVERAAPGRELFISGLRSAVTSGVGSNAVGNVLEGLLAASEVGKAPHTVALLDMRARRKPSGTGAIFESLQMILEIETDSGHDRILQTIRTILIDGPAARGDHSEGEPSQSVLNLPGGRTGVAFRRAQWGPTRTISWCSTDRAFTIGLGDGALRRWFAPAPLGDIPWAPHTDAVNAARPEGRECLRAFLDIDAMRASFPSAFNAGRTPRLRAALGLDSADSFMIHARFVASRIEDAPPLIAIDLTAAEQTGIDLRALSEHAWPEDPSTVPPPPGSYVVLINADWPRLYNLALALHESTIQNPDLDAFRESRASWETANRDALHHLFAALAPRLILTDVPPPIAPIPGMCTIIAESRQGIPASDLLARLDAVLTAWDELINESAASERWFKLDDRGIIRLPAWGAANRAGRSAIIGSWAVAAVRAASDWYRSATPGTGSSSGPSPTP